MPYSGDEKILYLSRDTLENVLAGDAERMVQIYGGNRLRIPEPDTQAFTDFVNKIGEQAATKLARLYAGSRVMVPLAMRSLKDRILELDAHSDPKLSAVDIARELRCALNYVYQVRHDARESGLPACSTSGEEEKPEPSIDGRPLSLLKSRNRSTGP